jgi:hypothetical protein
MNEHTLKNEHVHRLISRTIQNLGIAVVLVLVALLVSVLGSDRDSIHRVLLALYVTIMVGKMRFRSMCGKNPIRCCIWEQHKERETTKKAGVCVFTFMFMCASCVVKYLFLGFSPLVGRLNRSFMA